MERKPPRRGKLRAPGDDESPRVMVIVRTNALRIVVGKRDRRCAYKLTNRIGG
jgi:hypothetical protein